MLLVGDSREWLPKLKDNSMAAIVTDPPYELGFMNKGWDSTGIAYDTKFWEQCYRVLKPGGHLLVFGGKRTYHRMACAVEDAGFTIRESITWLYGSGFPKALDISKAIDKMQGANRTKVLVPNAPGNQPYDNSDSPSGVDGRRDTIGFHDESKPVTPEAKQWEGWKTQLKPASEPIVVAQKPISEKTIAANVLKHGVGAYNIDGCRGGIPPSVPNPAFNTTGQIYGFQTGEGHNGEMSQGTQGRFPADLVLSHAEWCVETGTDAAWDCVEGCPVAALDADSGASRFFPCFKYQAKAPSRERPKVDGVSHPTVKPLALMQWLVRLVTPPGGTILDPFAGSGATLEAALLEGFQCIGIEREEKYIPLIQQRMGEELKIKRVEKLTLAQMRDMSNG